MRIYLSRLVMAVAFSMMVLSSSAQWATNGNDISNSNSGLVGIGGTTPGYKLGVTIPISTSIIGGTPNAYGAYFTDNTSSTLAIRSLGNGAMHLTSDGGSRRLVLGGGSFEQTLFINSGNKVGIGIPDPGSSLAIKGAQSVEETVLNITNMSDQDFQVKLSGAGAGIKRTVIGPSTLNRFSLGVNLSEHLTIVNGGNIGIGTTTPDQKLTVNGIIHTKEVKIDLSVPGPDYVFEKDYQLPSLEQIKSYIDANKHLPEVPSAKEMEANGVNVGEMNMLLLKKVEELMLYVIEMEKQNTQAKNNVIEANKKIEVQQKQIEMILESINKK